MSRFIRPSDKLTKDQRGVLRVLGDGPPRPPDAVPYKLIANAKQTEKYKPPQWVAPIR